MQFISNHWPLCLAFTGILLLILINEQLDRKKRAEALSPQAAVALMNNEDASVFDLRDAESFRKGHILNAMRVCDEDFSQQKMDKYKSKPVIFVCARGLQSAALAAKLRQQGFAQPMVLAGGISAWQTAELPLVKGK